MKRVINLITAGRIRPSNGGETMETDHFVQTFTVTIRSLNGVHPETLRGVIQSRYEVTEITPTDELVVGHAR